MEKLEIFMDKDRTLFGITKAGKIYKVGVGIPCSVKIKTQEEIDEQEEENERA